MFEVKGRLGSAKQKLFKVVRLISSLGKEHPNVSSPTAVSTVFPCGAVNLLTNYSLEAELKKAQAKNWHMLDRPG